MTRIKRIGWWTLKAVAVLPVLFYAVAGVATLWFGHQVESQIREIARRGEPITLPDLMDGSHGQNSDRLVSALKEIADLKLSRKESEALADVGGFWEPRPDESVWQSARSTLARTDGPLDQIADVARDGDSAIVFSALPWDDKSYTGTSDLRGAVRALASRAIIRARDGNTSGAAADLEASALTARAASPKGALIGSLVRIACLSITCAGVRNALEFVTFSEDESARLCQALDGAIPDDLVYQAMLYERAYAHLLFEAVRDGEVDEMGELLPASKRPGFLRKFCTLPSRAMLYANEAVCLNAITRNSELFRRPSRELSASRLENEIENSMPRWAKLARTYLPVFSRPIVAADRGRATVAATQSLIALTRYRARNGVYPVSLDQAQIAGCKFGNDPFSGKPFGYRRKGDGILLYSIGEDLKDNGGKAAKRNYRWHVGTDMVWTLGLRQ